MKGKTNCNSFNSNFSHIFPLSYKLTKPFFYTAILSTLHGHYQVHADKQVFETVIISGQTSIPTACS